MEFRLAVHSDMDNIMNIIRQAQEYLRNSGINQWQNNYPNADTILSDVNNHYSYVLTGDEGIIGTVAVVFDGEKTYDRIYEGQWISSLRFAVIHRIAVEAGHKGIGLASEIIRNVEAMCVERGFHSIRSDTHKGNKSMQRLLLKNGFQYCGIIYLSDGNERIAFEKLV